MKSTKRPRHQGSLSDFGFASKEDKCSSQVVDLSSPVSSFATTGTANAEENAFSVLMSSKQVISAPVSTFASTTGTTNAKGSAFSILMSSKQVIKQRALSFQLMLTDGKLATCISDDVNKNTTEQHKWSCEVKVKQAALLEENLILSLSTNIASASSWDKSSGVASRSPANDSVLKSMLQKAIRRRLTGASIRLAMALSLRNMDDFLRRLTIICVEDVSLHPSFSIVVWLMIAVSKGFKFPCLTQSTTNDSDCYIHAVLLHIVGELAMAKGRDELAIRLDKANVYALCQSLLSRDCDAELVHSTQSSSDSQPVRSSPSTCNSPESSSLPLSLTATIQSSPLEDELDVLHNAKTYLNDIFEISLLDDSILAAVRTLVMSMVIRAAYGGMKGDVEMLQRQALLWLTRFCASLQQAHATVRVDESLFPTYSMHTYLHSSTIKSLYCAGLCGTSMLSVYMTSSTDDDDLECGRRVELGNLTKYIRRHQYASVLEEPHKPTSDAAWSILTPSDLILEGIDFHCDHGLVPWVLEELQQHHLFSTLLWSEDRLFVDVVTTSTTQRSGVYLKHDDLLTTNLIKKCMWLFRSSCNFHSPTFVYPAHLPKHIKLGSAEGEKFAISLLWGFICPFISKYCNRKKNAMVSTISK